MEIGSDTQTTPGPDPGLVTKSGLCTTVTINTSRPVFGP